MTKTKDDLLCILLEKQKLFLEQYKKLREETNQKFKKMFEEGAADIFANYPELQSFGWKQYTPYYCDGDQCYFSVNTSDLYLNGISVYDMDDEESVLEEELADLDKTIGKLEKSKKASLEQGDYDSASGYKQKLEEFYAEKHKLTKKLSGNNWSSEVVEVLRNWLNKFDAEFFEDLFGDHVKITITPQGVETKQYTSHD